MHFCFIIILDSILSSGGRYVLSFVQHFGRPARSGEGCKRRPGFPPELFAKETTQTDSVADEAVAGFEAEVLPLRTGPDGTLKGGD